MLKRDCILFSIILRLMDLKTYVTQKINETGLEQ